MSSHILSSLVGNSVIGHQIEDHLNKVEAYIEAYRLTVKKSSDEAELEVEFKALIRPKNKTIRKYLN